MRQTFAPTMCIVSCPTALGVFAFGMGCQYFEPQPLLATIEMAESIVNFVEKKEADLSDSLFNPTPAG